MLASRRSFVRARGSKHRLQIVSSVGGLIGVAQVLSDHALGIENSAIYCDRVAHDARELLRHLVEQGQDNVLQLSIQRINLARTRSGVVFDRPTRDALDM